MKCFEMTGEMNTPQELYQWMSSHIKYSHPSNWTLKSVYDTMMSGSGDCHDQTLFEYKYFQSIWGHKYKPVPFFMIKPDGSATHSFLAFYENGKYFWFENSWKGHTGINGPYKNLPELKKDVLTQWCSQYGGDPDNTYIGKMRCMTPGVTIEEFCKKNVK